MLSDAFFRFLPSLMLDELLPFFLPHLRMGFQQFSCYRLHRRWGEFLLLRSGSLAACVVLRTLVFMHLFLLECRSTAFSCLLIDDPMDVNCD